VSLRGGYPRSPYFPCRKKGGRKEKRRSAFLPLLYSKKEKKRDKRSNRRKGRKSLMVTSDPDFIPVLVSRLRKKEKDYLFLLLNLVVV